MKRLNILLAVSLISGISWGQSLDKGNIIGIHIFTLDLNTDVTIDQYKDFFLTRYIPALNKNLPDVEHYIARGNRGKSGDEIGLVVVFGSQEIKKKYYHKDGSTTKFMNSLLEKVQPIRTRLDSLGKVTAEYMEWVIE